MPKSLTELQLESELMALLEHIEQLDARIRTELPPELLFTHSGSPNLQHLWGAVLFNLAQTRATLRAFQPKEDPS